MRTVYAVRFFYAVSAKKKMNKFFTTKRICRAGLIAALYVVLTCPLVSFAYGPFQIRPAEALCILPLFFPESIVALYVGCMIANAVSVFGIFDIFLGSLATLIAATLTFICGMVIRNNLLKVIVGGFFPVIVNAFIVPAVWLLADSTTYAVYWYNFGTMILNEAVWVYALGIPLFYGILNLQKKGVAVFLDKKKPTPASTEPSTEANTEAAASTEANTTEK